MDQNIKLIKEYAIQDINAENFDNIALSVFRYQYNNNIIYRQFADVLGVDAEHVKGISEIPFLPVSFFKTHRVASEERSEAELTFESSGTTGETPAQHFVADHKLYETALLSGFRQFYGDPSEYVVIALLPSYLERKNASLVHMARVLMQVSKQQGCGFYLNEWGELHQLILKLESLGKKILLLGVTFAVLDFSGAYPMKLEHTIVMETGGMKGRKKEWTRQQVHNELKKNWQLEDVHSEYGMTELLSQAYATKDGIFHCSSTMKVLCRDINDPLQLSTEGSGCLNIIDLANLYSCSFIATDDIGNIATDGTFQVQGRADHSALRGCSLMVL